MSNKKNSKFSRKFQIMEPVNIVSGVISIYPDEYEINIDKETRIKEKLLINYKIKKKNQNKFYLSAKIEGEIYSICSRCLEEATLKITERELTHYFEYSEYPTDKNHDENLTFYTTSYIDLLPFFREEILFFKPVFFVCSIDCKGLCPSCGISLNNTDHICKNL